MRHIISVLLENESGALSRVSGLFSARGFNIESLVVAPTNDESLSRLTLVTMGDDKIIEQIVKQLEKLIDTVSVIDLTKDSHIERELMLVKILIKPINNNKIKELVDVFSACIVSESKDICIIDMSGTSEQLDAFLRGIDSEDILEISRTGAMGIYLGQSVL